MSDGTSTQVVVQMIDKCRIEMTQRELYNVRDLPWIKGGGQIKRETLKQSENKFVIIPKIKIQELISSDLSEDNFPGKKLAFFPSKKTIQHFALLPKLIREMPFF